MHVRRRLVVLMFALLVALPAAGVAAAQTPGEEQSQDQLLGEDGNGSDAQPDDLEPLTPTPQGEPNPSPGNGGKGERRRNPASGDGLPDTGTDARVMLLLGAALLLTGVGLRLRTSPEHF